MIAIDVTTAVLAQADGAEQGTTWWETVQSGGVIGYIIIGMSVVALALCIMHLVQIRRAALIPPPQLDRLDELLSQGHVAAALEYCYDPKAVSYLTRIMAAGLTRYQKSAFGAFEIKNAIEEAAEDQTARLYRSTDALAVIATTAPLLGLLGTVQGMVGAFGTLSQGASPSHEQLAANISLALVTTLLGLIVAIPCVALHRYFGNRIDAFASEAALEIERLVLHLESASIPAQSRLPRPRPVARAAGPAPGPAPAPPSTPAGAPSGKAAP